MAMNLIQVQNRLRDLPANDPRSMQMLTAFANGKNPQIPPFIALAELNRRKQLEQSKAQPPEATVKDKIEQEVKMLQTNAGRQQEAMQNMGRQAMMANAGKIPASTPPTEAVEEDSFAAGGIASLNSKFDFAKGGIVAFAGPTKDNNNSSVEDKDQKEKDREQLASDQEALSEMLTKLGAAGKDVVTLPGRAAAGVLNAGVIRPARAISGKEIPYIYGSTPDYVENMTPFYDKIRAKENSQDKQQPSKTETAAPAANLNADVAPAKTEPQGMTPEQKVQMLMGNRGQSGSASSGARVSSGAPAGGDIYSMLVQNLKNDKYEAAPDYETVMNQQRAKNPEMQGKAGSKLEMMIEEIRRQDVADRAEAKAQQEARKSNRLLDVLTGAGQGMGKFNAANQRGKAGLMNLLGGIGQQYKAMGEEDIQRSKEQKALERQQNLAYAEMMGRIEDVRRAEATGNAQKIYDAKVAAHTAQQNYKKIQADRLYQGANVEEQRRHGMATEANQRLSTAQQGRDVVRERAAALATDPTNRNKTLTELMQLAATLGTGVQAENAETQRVKAVDAAWKDSPLGMQEKVHAFKPDSKEYKDILAKKKEFYFERGVNLGSGGGSGGAPQIPGKVVKVEPSK